MKMVMVQTEVQSMECIQTMKQEVPVCEGCARDWVDYYTAEGEVVQNIEIKGVTHFVCPPCEAKIRYS